MAFFGKELHRPELTVVEASFTKYEWMLSEDC